MKTHTDRGITMRKHGLLGRKKPFTAEERPRLVLEEHMAVGTVPAPPAVVDYASKVTTWPVYLNDQLGDCTCAGIGHAIQAWTAYAGSEVTVTDNDILKLYEKTGGYVPGNPDTDGGAVMQNVLEYLEKTGIAGHKVMAFAQLRHCRNLTTLKTVLNLFGTVYLGINCPDSAQEQFDHGLPWTVVHGAQIEGGHCIVLQKYDAEVNPLEIVTWGELQRMSTGFAQEYIEEAWVIITKDWFEANGDTVAGLDLTALGADFAAITGRRNPFITLDVETADSLDDLESAIRTHLDLIGDGPLGEAWDSLRNHLRSALDRLTSL
jgi:hypothetical protein